MDNPLSIPLDWRYRTSKNKTKSVDDIIKGLRRFYKTPDQKKYEHFKIIFEIYENKMYKCNMESMLLAGCKHEDCADYFGIDVGTVALYESVFFDMSKIRNSKARVMKEALTSLSSEKELKLCAAQFGSEVLLNILGVCNTIDSNKLIKRIKDGILVKTLGHELVGSNSTSMNSYLKMMATVIPKAEVEAQSSQFSNKADDALKYLSNFFEKEK